MYLFLVFRTVSYTRYGTCYGDDHISFLIGFLNSRWKLYTKSTYLYYYNEKKC